MQFSRQRSRNQLCLIVSSLASALSMERHRHDDVSTKFFRFSGYYFSQAGSEPIAQACHFFKFQKQDRFSERLVVRAKTPSDVERVKLVATEAATRLSRCA